MSSLPEPPEGEGSDVPDPGGGGKVMGGPSGRETPTGAPVVAPLVVTGGGRRPVPLLAPRRLPRTLRATLSVSRSITR